MELHQFHILIQQVMGGRVTVAVAEDHQQMLNQLHEEGILETEAPRTQGTIHQLAGEPLLHTALVQHHLENRLHDGVELLGRERSGHQRVLNRLHNGGIEAIPSLRSLDLVGADSITPFHSSITEVLELFLHLAIRTNLDAQGLLGLVGLEALVEEGALLKVQISGTGRLTDIVPLAANATDLDQAPVALFRG